MDIIVERNVFNDAYLPSLLDYDKRYEIYYGGSGSGKSHFVAQKLIIKAVNDVRKILVCRKVGRTVKNSVFQLLLQQLQFFQLLPLCKVNKTDFTIELSNGSKFLCTGLDDAEKVKSIVGLTDIWMEEATQFLQDDFNQLDLRLRHPTAAGQQMILSFNPVSKVNYCYKLFFNDKYEDEQEKKEIMEFRGKCKILKTTYQDNQHLPQQYIDSLLLLKGTNPTYFSIYALGEFGSLSKLIYSNWKVQEFNHKDVKGQLLVGLDFGFVNDTTALICSLLDEKNKKIYVFDEWGDVGKTNPEIAQVIKDKGLAKSVIIADSAEQKSIEEIKREGINRIKGAVKGKGSILSGIQKLQQYQLIIHPSCKQTIEQLSNYSWKKDKNTNEYYNQPVDKWNHFLDALRYSLQCADTATKLKTMNKNILF